MRARHAPTQRALIRHAIEHGEVERLAEIVAIVRETGALDATRDAAREAEADKRAVRLAATALPELGVLANALLRIVGSIACERSSS